MIVRAMVPSSDRLQPATSNQLLTKLNFDPNSSNSTLATHGKKFCFADQETSGRSAGIAGRTRDGGGGRGATASAQEIHSFLGVGGAELRAQQMSGARLGAGLHDVAGTDSAAGGGVGGIDQTSSKQRQTEG